MEERVGVRANPLLELRRLGQGVWLDNLSRALLRGGELRRRVADDGLSGVTSNPSIFHHAIAGGEHYREDLRRLKDLGLGAEQCYEALAVADIQEACDALRPVHEATRGDDGYVSLEVSPRLAYDEEATVAAALRLRNAVARDNVLIKVPATEPGLAAFRRLIAQGVGVNVTLMFSLGHVQRFAAAYIEALRERQRDGGDLRGIKSVASLFLSRVDALVDRRLDALATPAAADLRGLTAISMARVAWRRYEAAFHGEAFAGLRAAGARPQYLLWASTGAKDPRHGDLHYVEPLVGPETVSTMPEATLAAFRDHGRATLTLPTGLDLARGQLAAVARLGIDLDRAADELQADGVRRFEEAYGALLEVLG